MQNGIEIYYDREGNYLEIIFEKKEGFFQKTENEDIMQKVDKEGNVLAVSILNAISNDKTHPLSYSLKLNEGKSALPGLKNVSDKDQKYNKK